MIPAAKRRSARAGSPLVIGLVNNMPDGAFQATERQFEDLLHAAAGGQDVSLRYLAVPEIQRGEHARAHMRGRYAHIDRLPAAGLDGLIVTGAEPKTARLEDELYWPSLARVIDWSRTAEVPTIWSCLAAHAVALRLDGVQRRLLDTKRTGVFICEPMGSHPLLTGARTPMAPHSRLNDLAEDDLRAAGYQILTRAPEVGVDLCLKPGPALTLLFQGHPEYAAETLLREYLRDVGRYLRGERDGHPTTPSGYLDEETLAKLDVLAARGETARIPERLGDYVDATAHAAPKATWRPWAVSIYRAWLDHVRERRAGGIASADSATV